MYPVARITPEANALTTANKSLSGRSAGIIRENNGKHTPIMPYRGVLLFELDSHCSAMVVAGNVNDRRIRIREEVAVPPPNPKALNWFCSLPESDGVFPRFFLSKEPEDASRKPLYLHTTLGVFWDWSGDLL
ncbi:hypothetical protein NC653_020985 [Populus alba x Populus x berolinensis]|uniref:Uncharacterized protein n=3 Tax=Populus TaxID=3689 RepID=A0A4U5NPN6_POPAL|nr:hypothetical protein NC653_020985 [Populus alba x Populus x berolinensis]TKR84996.1 hypothetical protein D5086_0000253490 [Populus alba]